MVHQLVDIAHALRMNATDLFEQVGDTSGSSEDDPVDPQMEDLLMKLTVAVRTKKS